MLEKRCSAIVGRNVLCYGAYANVLNAAQRSSTRITEILLEEGQTLFPGFIDPHVHIVLSAMLYEFEDFGPFVGHELRCGYSPAFVREHLVSILKDRTPGQHWVLGKLLDPSLMPFSTRNSKRTLNKLARLDTDFFDSITGDVPVMILSASLHTAYVNTQVLSVLFKKFEELRRQFKDLDAYRAHVNARGGLQEMTEIIQAMECVPLWQLAPMVAKLNSNLEKVFKGAFAVGITTLYDAGMTAEQKIALEGYLALHRRAPRIGYAQVVSSIKEARALPPAKPVTRERFDRGLYQGHVKLVSDGSNQGLTGFQNEVYCCEPAGNYGQFNFGNEASTPKEYKALFETILNKGYSMMVICQQFPHFSILILL